VRLTEEQYADLVRRRAPAPKPRKYRNEPAVSTDGERFDSKLERDYYEQLVLRWKAGDILWFVRQVTFKLEGGVKYRADFLVVTKSGVEVIDTTGVMTQVKANKLKQVKARYGIEVQLVRKTS
jgi:2-polyprenyl-3-methyl-5-hydroxy-6-metoxy-1,4-benzoquinol methylase